MKVKIIDVLVAAKCLAVMSTFPSPKTTTELCPP